MRKALCAVILLAALSCAATTQAGLMGSTLTMDYRYPNAATVHVGRGDPITFVVGNEVEAPAFMSGPRFTVDVSDTQIRAYAFRDYMRAPGLERFTPASYNGLVFSDNLNLAPAFVGLTVNPESNIVGLDASRLWWDSNHLYVNWAGLSYNANTRVVLDVSTAVPVPNSLAAIASLGAVGVVMAYRRRRKAA